MVSRESATHALGQQLNVLLYHCYLIQIPAHNCPPALPTPTHPKKRLIKREKQDKSLCLNTLSLLSRVTLYIQNGNSDDNPPNLYPITYSDIHVLYIPTCPAGKASLHSPSQRPSLLVHDSPSPYLIHPPPRIRQVTARLLAPDGLFHSHALYPSTVVIKPSNDGNPSG